MSFRGDVSAKRRIHLQLPAELEADIKAVGREHGIGLGPAIRVVLGRGIGRGIDRGPVAEACRDCEAGLAALLAAEHTLLVVASILPGGRSLIDGLAADAAAAAERRLGFVGRVRPGNEAAP
jgi:hypothetical protein